MILATLAGFALLLAYASILDRNTEARTPVLTDERTNLLAAAAPQLERNDGSSSNGVGGVGGATALSAKVVADLVATYVPHDLQRDVRRSDPDTPSNAEGTPSNAEGTPSNAEGTQSNAEGTPSNAEGTPSNAEGTPSNAEGTPSNAEGTPSNAEGAPSNADLDVQTTSDPSDRGVRSNPDHSVRSPNPGVRSPNRGVRSSPDPGVRSPSASAVDLPQLRLHVDPKRQVAVTLASTEGGDANCAWKPRLRGTKPGTAPPVYLVSVRLVNKVPRPAVALIVALPQHVWLPRVYVSLRSSTDRNTTLAEAQPLPEAPRWVKVTGQIAAAAGGVRDVGEDGPRPLLVNVTATVRLDAAVNDPHDWVALYCDLTVDDLARLTDAAAAAAAATNASSPGEGRDLVLHASLSVVVSAVHTTLDGTCTFHLEHRSALDAVPVELPVGVGTVPDFVEVVHASRTPSPPAATGPPAAADSDVVAAVPPPQTRMAVCYGPIFSYGAPGSVRVFEYLVELVEFHRSIGVAPMVFYMTWNTPSAAAVTAFAALYEHDPAVVIVNTTLADKRVHTYYHNQRLLIADCLNRVSGPFGYAAVLDVDEWLVPWNTTLQDALAYLRSIGPNYGLWTFRVDADYVLDLSVCERHSPDETFVNATRQRTLLPSALWQSSSLQEQQGQQPATSLWLALSPYFQTNQAAGKDVNNTVVAKGGGRVKSFGKVEVSRAGGIHLWPTGNTARSYIPAQSGLRKVHMRDLPFAPAHPTCKAWADEWLAQPTAAAADGQPPDPDAARSLRFSLADSPFVAQMLPNVLALWRRFHELLGPPPSARPRRGRRA